VRRGLATLWFKEELRNKLVLGARSYGNISIPS
jgi:hypothetical protein